MAGGLCWTKKSSTVTMPWFTGPAPVAARTGQPTLPWRRVQIMSTPTADSTPAPCSSMPAAAALVGIVALAFAAAKIFGVEMPGLGVLSFVCALFAMVVGFVTRRSGRAPLAGMASGTLAILLLVGVMAGRVLQAPAPKNSAEDDERPEGGPGNENRRLRRHSEIAARGPR